MPISDYIAQVRERIGQDLLWLPGVNAVITNDAGEILLGQRADNGRWALIAGFVEPGEQPAEAIVREVYEETGVHIVPDRISMVMTQPPVTYPNGDTCQYLTITFRCHAVGGQARVNDDESLAVDWFRQDALPDLDEAARTRIAHSLGPATAAWFVQFAD